MAQFIAAIKGSRGEASRIGTKRSGMWGYVNGWNIGGRVEIYHDPADKCDVVSFFLTA